MCGPPFYPLSPFQGLLFMFGWVPGWEENILAKGKDKIALNCYGIMSIPFTQYRETSLLMFVPH